MNEPKSTILITGASGRIGFPLAQPLAESFNVVGFDRRAQSHPRPSAECLYVDLAIDESLRPALQAISELHGDRLASVIHLAAYYDLSLELTLHALHTHAQTGNGMGIRNAYREIPLRNIRDSTQPS